MKFLYRASSLLLALCLPVVAAQVQAVRSDTVGKVLETPAMAVPQLESAVFIELARAGDRLVAVGERGLIALSDDQGESWRQASVPVSVSLTAVQFIDADHGWAVGHGGVVLATQDGGEHWQVRLTGIEAARLELDAARAAQPGATDTRAADLRVQLAERLLAEGPDKPFLALHFSDAGHGLVVGAFGLAFRTEDGGHSWRSAVGQIENPYGMHIYAIAREGHTWYLGGEQGFLARADNGRDFRQLESPYEGTYFTLQARAGGGLLLAGMKGHAFVSSDRGESFAPLASRAGASFSDSIALPGGDALLSNQAGMLFRLTAAGHLAPFAQPLRRPVSGLTQAPDGGLVFAGFTGLFRLAPNDITASE
ncbi:hypothetical protein GCM10011348_03700 [Marinobacterium nitratireducens]|uniref:Photosynthesis system II assembly factor Ycf48/Hcf136-like domain-containing protein n=1 Tax=Marinobacterium nitratireducens TaxID=518897 RepID=A0A917Z987_9GAMM|nr:YCF48-related protein [Marinobacterium nitratireducens]GGO76453.1 hypothetical protein GCM10011348_03700 [Marinobacterium nitratireducens]